MSVSFLATPRVASVRFLGERSFRACLVMETPKIEVPPYLSGPAGRRGTSHNVPLQHQSGGVPVRASSQNKTRSSSHALGTSHTFDTPASPQVNPSVARGRSEGGASPP